MVKKKTIIRYKLKILALVKKIPVTTYEASKHASCHYDTAKKILEFLERVGKVEKFKLFTTEEEDYKELWRIKK